MTPLELMGVIVAFTTVFVAVVVTGFRKFARFRDKEMESSRRFRELHGDTRHHKGDQ